MGADMVFNYLVISRDTEPDFTAARRHLTEMSPERIHKAIIQSEGLEGLDDNHPDWRSLDEAKNIAKDALDTVEQGWNAERRDFVTFPVKEYVVLFAGEMTWGDAPEGFTVMERFRTLGLDKVAGFI